MMMPKFIAAYDGLHFVAGVGVKQLQDYLRGDEGLKKYSESFLGLSRAFVSLTSSDLFKLGGFAVVLQPKQVIEVPPGFLLAQTGLSTTSIIVHWVSARPDKEALSWSQQIEVAYTLVQNDLGEGEAATGTVSDSESSFLKKMKFQLSVAPILLEKVSQSRLAAQQDAIRQSGIDSLDPLRDKYLKDQKLQDAVMHSD